MEVIMKRFFLSVMALVSVAAFAQTKYSHYYTNLPCAVEQVQEVVIPDYTVTLTDFGAVGDGQTDCSEAFAAALKDLKRQGGGHLIVPDGIWLTGPIRLISNFDLHLADKATILFSTNKELYIQKNDSLRDGSKKCNACIYGSKLENVAITGHGTLDGQGIYWRPVKQKKVDELSERVKQAEVDEVISIANEFKLTPEKLYEMVKGKSETEVIKDVVHNKPFNPVTTVKKDEEEII